MSAYYFFKNSSKKIAFFNKQMVAKFYHISPEVTSTKKKSTCNQSFLLAAGVLGRGRWIVTSTGILKAV
jgi:hypothetical protein